MKIDFQHLSLFYKMYSIFDLPKELKKEIYFYTSVRDIASLYDSYKLNPSCQDLYEIAVLHQLPSATSFDVLISFQEEKSLEERVVWCIANNDVVSFTRLYPLVEKIDLSFLTSQDEHGETDNPLRPKIARLIIERLIKEEDYEDDAFLIAVRHKDYEMIKTLLKLDVDVEAWQFYPNYREEEILKLIQILSTYSNYMTEEWYRFWDRLLEFASNDNFAQIVSFLLSLGPEEKYNVNVLKNLAIENVSSSILVLLARKGLTNEKILLEAMRRDLVEIIDIMYERNPNLYVDYPYVQLVGYFVKKGELSRRKAYLIAWLGGGIQDLADYLQEEPYYWLKELEYEVNNKNNSVVFEMIDEAINTMYNVNVLTRILKETNNIKLLALLINSGKVSKNKVYDIIISTEDSYIKANRLATMLGESLPGEIIMKTRITVPW